MSHNTCNMFRFSLANFPLEWNDDYPELPPFDLFQSEESVEVEYRYDECQSELASAISVPLERLLLRLELLGHTISMCEEHYAEMEDTVYSTRRPPPFENLRTYLSRYDLSRTPAFPESCLYHPESRLPLKLFTHDLDCDPDCILGLDYDNDEVLKHVGSKFILRLLSENPRNLKQNVIWRHQFIDDFDPKLLGCPKDQRILIVSEGSTDTNVLSRSLPAVLPDVVDFFQFIDMKDNYPFAGTGQIVNFCKGLASIEVQNKIVIVLDNDTAGHKAAKQIRELELPDTLKVFTLPDLEEFKDARTVGPTGESRCDINGRAVSIECFLDFGKGAEPLFRWTSYDSSMQEYQGEIEGKRAAIKRFLAARLNDGAYDLSKLRFLWLSLIDSYLDCEHAYTKQLMASDH